MKAVITKTESGKVILDARYSDVTDIVKRLNQLFDDSGVYIDENTKKCCDCGEILPITKFNGILGITCVDRCDDCADMTKAYWMIKSDIRGFLQNAGFEYWEAEEIAIKAIKPEHIKTKAMLMKLRRKIKQLNKTNN